MSRSIQHIRVAHSAFAGILMLALMLWGGNHSLRAQPGNPSYSLSTSSYFEVEILDIALMDIETTAGSNNFSLSVPIPTEAGAGLPSNPIASYSSNWINYSCAARSVSSRNIQVNISSGSLPPGLQLYLTVTAASGTGAGTLGTSVATTMLLSSSTQNILTGIRGAYTGNGAGNGHQLIYELHYDGLNFNQLEDLSSPITILYTLYDN